MTYQALARKWRPKNFAELSGQEHVVRALGNALDRQRLHHAYLLTGTRGVVDAGRFVDLLELDAASNTGIDNMREILDNARYAPTAGRYKVYLIDEVHMLSKAAFNSMLKTLEEPPEHVKFVLATTDPQKIPVTVLSRCLQFNLKQLPPATIAARLGSILEAEGVASDAGALHLVARAAQGSMRDALSLLDQAIAYGAGEVREEVVRTMLGAVDSEHAYRIVEALLARDGVALLAEADAMAARNVTFATALEELASLFHRIAIAQTVPAATATMDDGERVGAYAERMAAEDVQLAYQIAVQGRADLALAPDEAMGFSMTLLRLLAFEPGAAPSAMPPSGAATVAAGRPASAPRSAPTAAVSAPAGAAPGRGAAEPAPRRPLEPASRHAPLDIPVAASAPEAIVRPLPASADEWIALVATLKVPGLAGQLAAQSEWRRSDGRELVLAVAEAQRHLTERAYADKLRSTLEGALGGKVRLAFETIPEADASLAAKERRERAERKEQSEAAFRDEPFVQDVLARFEARIKPDSVKPAS